MANDLLQESLRKLNKVGAALSAERDLNKLLELILTSAREITGCDAGSLYLVETITGNEPVANDFLADKRLFFKFAQNDSVDFAFTAGPLDIDKHSIAGYVATSGELLNIDDVRIIGSNAPYRFNFAFDESNGYTSVSMLAIPMKNHRGELLGILQLINRRKDADAPLGKGFHVNDVLAFDSAAQELTCSLASQAAVALENSILYDEIRELFDSFVHASVSAIESRDPTTSGHSERVSRMTVALARQVDRSLSGKYRDVKFSRTDISQIEYASLLHDFGKIGVREAVLIKAKKLYPHELDRIENRAREVALHLRLDTVKTQLSCVAGGGAAVESIVGIEERLSQRLERLEGQVDVIRKANHPSVLDEKASTHLKTLAEEKLDIPGCDILTILDEKECARLGIRRGSLSEDERREIESHVTHTYNYLQNIPWPRDYRRVPEIAYAHHEKLNGKGYPRGLKGDAIPIEARMMTISDIFDALTAWDRPYKKAVPLEKAIAILEDEAARGAIDSELWKIFLETEVFRGIVRG